VIRERIVPNLLSGCRQCVFYSLCFTRGRLVCSTLTSSSAGLLAKKM